MLLCSPFGWGFIVERLLSLFVLVSSVGWWGAAPSVLMMHVCKGLYFMFSCLCLLGKCVGSAWDIVMRRTPGGHLCECCVSEYVPALRSGLRFFLMRRAWATSRCVVSRALVVRGCRERRSTSSILLVRDEAVLLKCVTLTWKLLSVFVVGISVGVSCVLPCPCLSVHCCCYTCVVWVVDHEGRDIVCVHGLLFR